MKEQTLAVNSLKALCYETSIADGSDLIMLLDPEAWKTKSQNLATAQEHHQPDSQYSPNNVVQTKVGRLFQLKCLLANCFNEGLTRKTQKLLNADFYGKRYTE